MTDDPPVCPFCDVSLEVVHYDGCFQKALDRITELETVIELALDYELPPEVVSGFRDVLHR